MGYEELTVDDLHDRLKGKGVGGIWETDKAELVEVLSRIEDEDRGGDGGRRRGGDAGRSAGEKLEAGKSTTTRDHDVIRRWAEARGAQPATVPGTEHGDHLGVLRFDFPGYGGEDLEHVSWDEWFDTFDSRNLEFLYQDQKKDGNQSNFFRLLNPDREDA